MSKNANTTIVVVLNVLFGLASLQGVVLGYKVNSDVGFYMLLTTVSPLVTGVVYWATLGGSNLAQIGSAYYYAHLADTNLFSTIALVGLAIACWMLLSVWFKILTMFVRK